MSGCNPSRPFVPIFIRLTSGSGTELWPGLKLSFRQVARLVSPGKWNHGIPSIRAYALRKQGTERGITLIETADVVQWLNTAFGHAGSSQPLISNPPSIAPVILHIPRPGDNCPYTGLKHTVLVELVAPCSPYGHTRIKTVPCILPGNTSGKKMIKTETLLRYLRSLPPPRYKISPNRYSEDS